MNIWKYQFMGPDKLGPWGPALPHTVSSGPGSCQF